MKITRVSLLLLLLFLLPPAAFAQQEEEAKAAGLRKRLAVEKDDKMRVDLMVDLAYNCSDTAEKFRYFREARALAQQIDYKKGLGDAYATEAYERLEYADYATLTYLYTEALKVRNEIQDLQGLAECYHELGLLDLQFKNYSHAFFNFKKAIALNEKTGNKQWLHNNYEAIGSVYSETKKIDSAMICLRKADAIARENQLDASLLYHSMANIFLGMGQLDSCELYIRKSDSASIVSGNEYEQVWNRVLSASLLTRKGKPAEAIPVLEQVYAYAREDKDAELLLAVIPELIDAYNLAKEYEKGFRLQDEWIYLKDSLVSLDKANLVVGTQLEYEAGEREKINRMETERQKLIRNVFIGGFLLLGVLAFVIFRSLQQNKRSKRIIELQKEQVEEKQREIVDSITYAKRLQQAILPPENMVKEHFPESFILYKPKDIVAGDFYWMENVNGKIFLAAADCTGHGVPGAMVSVVCCNALNRAVKEFGLTDPGKILDKVRELVLETFEKSGEDVKDGMDISLFSAQAPHGGERRVASEEGQVKSDISTNTRHPSPAPRPFSWAGANNPLWYVSENKIVEIKADKQPVGKQENAKDFTTHQLQIPAGGMVYLFTDGFADQFGGPKGKKFRYKQLEELLLSIVALPAEEQKQKLETAFNNWKGQLEQIDDVCVIGIRVG